MRNVNLKAVVADFQASGWRMSAHRLAECLKRLKAAGYVHHAAEYDEGTGRPVWILRASLTAQGSRVARPQRDRSGQVYAIRDRKTRHVKIGLSIDPEKRLSSLRTGSPTGMDLLWVGPGGRPLERRLHSRFSDRHVRGEWFDFSGCNAVEMIQQAAAEFGGAL
ncbi:GIY-YIG nuclease family protein [Streptomyces sp. NPDC056982]|uniref:GIY-YIG nuclease family protein n=1 Tax=Streptomyces sp. NPDC056982 TaxID=3345986 RepID=UPI00362D901A